MTFLPFTYTIYTLITHKSKKEAIQKKTLERFLQHTHLLKKELLIFNKEFFCSLFSFSSPIIIPWEEICTQTQPTPIQSVECFGA